MEFERLLTCIYHIDSFNFLGCTNPLPRGAADGIVCTLFSCFNGPMFELLGSVLGGLLWEHKFCISKMFLCKVTGCWPCHHTVNCVVSRFLPTSDVLSWSSNNVHLGPVESLEMPSNPHENNLEFASTHWWPFFRKCKQKQELGRGAILTE